MVPLDRVKAACRAVAELSTSARGLWAPAEFPRAAGSTDALITAQMVRGPHVSTHQTYGGVDEPTAIRWTVSAPVANTTVGLYVAGVRIVVDTGPAPTPTTVRDALQAAFTSWMLPDVTIAPAGADSLDFTSAIPGRLYHPIAIGPGATRTLTTTVCAEVTTGQADGTLQWTAYAAGPGMAAQGLLSELAAGMKLQPARTARSRLGVVIHGAGEPIDISATSGPTWESRATFRSAVSLRSYRSTAIEVIETAGMTLTTGTITTEISITP